MTDEAGLGLSRVFATQREPSPAAVTAGDRLCCGLPLSALRVCLKNDCCQSLEDTSASVNSSLHTTTKKKDKKGKKISNAKFQFFISSFDTQ